MTRRLITAGIAIAASGLFAVGCGSSDKKSTTATAQSHAAPTPGGSCKQAKATDPTGLPSGFPGTDMLTVTKVTKAGPTITLDGYSAGSLADTFAKWKDAVSNAPGYTVTFSEHEDADAEVFYKGEGRSGMVGLHGDCTEAGTTRVYITSRPA
jgi:hypothetical protein